jgi:nucleoside phosphorylase
MGIEMAPLIAMLDEEHQVPSMSNPRNTYRFGRISPHNVVIAIMPEIGISIASKVGIGLLQDFGSIRFGLLVGIGGGVPNGSATDIRLGDVVVSRPRPSHGGVIQYQIGKSGMLKRPPNVVSANVESLRSDHILGRSRAPFHLAEMLVRAPNMAREGYVYQGSDKDVLFEAAYRHRGGNTCWNCDPARVVRRSPRSNPSPRIHYGTITSGDAVVRDGTVRDSLRDKFGILCIEMEAAGLLDDFPCLVIRGISDYADSHKNKNWQPYAAAAAAAYTKELLRKIPPADVNATAGVSKTSKLSRMIDRFNELQEQARLENLQMKRAKAFWDPLVAMSKPDATSWTKSRD